MSVDPALAETDQPYAYASDDPVNEADPSGLDSKYGLTLGVCGSAAASIGLLIGIGLQGVGCALTSTSGNPGLSGTVGESLLNAGASAGVTANFLISDAGNVKEMAGPFDAVSASVSLNIPPFIVSGEVFWGISQGDSFNGIFGFDAGAGAGVGSPTAAIWYQFTWVYEFPGWTCWLSGICLGARLATEKLASSGPSMGEARHILQEVWPIVQEHTCRTELVV